MPIDGEAANNIGLAILGILGTGGIATIVAIIRHQIKASSDASVGMAHNSAEKGTINQLREEIARLEELVDRMQRRIDALEMKHQKTSLAFVEVQQALIDVEREMLSCGCDNRFAPRVKLQEAQDLLKKAIQENLTPAKVAEECVA